jgi:hypothetical protein
MLQIHANEIRLNPHQADRRYSPSKFPVNTMPKLYHGVMFYGRRSAGQQVGIGIRKKPIPIPIPIPKIWPINMNRWVGDLGTWITASIYFFPGNKIMRRF